MISLKELRVGNKVLYKGTQIEVDTDVLIYIKEYGGFPFQGIPITEDVLKDIGFEPTEKYRYTNGVVDIFFDGKVEYKGMSCKYLHELQNAYPVWTNGLII